MTHEELLTEILQLPLEERDELLEAIKRRFPLEQRRELMEEITRRLLGEPYTPGQWVWITQAALARGLRHGTHTPGQRLSGQEGLSLSQSLYGILKFDADPPTDEELKDYYADYLMEKYS